MATDTFATRKALGTTAEIALRDLLTAAGGIVELHQQNRDATTAHPGAAVAHHRAATVHLPDLTCIWPTHPLRRFGAEVKAKSPLSGGGFGWDVHAFDRAVRWSELSGDPVFYAVRDLSTAPLPSPGHFDDLDHWHVASTWKLLHAPSRSTVGRFHYWPLDVFVPLVVLLDVREITTATVGYLPLGDGPPMIL